MNMGWRTRIVAAGLALLSAASALPAAEPAGAPKDWLDQLKEPTPWLKWGADLRVRQEYLNNAFTLNQDADYHEYNYNRYRARIWGTATLPDQKNYELTARLTWEGRHWFEPDTKTKWQWADAVIDNLYVKATKPCDLPMVATVGRQDIFLADGWLVGDGTPLDGSRTFYLDAAKLTYNIESCKTEANFIFVEQRAQPVAFMHPIGNRDMYLTEQNERGGIVWLTNRYYKDTRIDIFGIYKHDSAVLLNGNDGDVYAIGGRYERQFGDNIVAFGEGAYEFGNKNGENLSALGALANVSYMFNDSLKNKLSLEYEFASGDDPDTDANEQFDLLWGRWPRWSELLIYTAATETRVSELVNMHRVSLGYQLAPIKDMKANLQYMLLFSNQNTLQNNPGFSSGGDFRGQLIRAYVIYQFSKHLEGHVWGEYFIPGNYYSDQRSDAAVFLRWQFILTL